MTMRATATTGTTTATAILPPGERLPEDILAPEVVRAAEPVLLADDEDGVVVWVTEAAGNRWPLCVDVMRIVCGPAFANVFPACVLAAIVVKTLMIAGDSLLCEVVCEVRDVFGDPATTVVVGACDVVEIKVDIPPMLEVSEDGTEFVTVWGGPEANPAARLRQYLQGLQKDDSVYLWHYWKPLSKSLGYGKKIVAFSTGFSAFEHVEY